MIEKNFGRNGRYALIAYWTKYEFYILPTFLVYRADEGTEFMFLWLGIHISVGDTF